jgi:Putative mono-oxygenase ydhR
MIAAFVRFQYGSDFDETKVRKIADAAHVKFEGMPGLRSKVFTVRPRSKEAINVYVWETEASAKAFFTDELVERITSLYGVRPVVEFADVAALVENRPT